MAAEDITNIFTGMPIDNGDLSGDRARSPWDELDERAKSIDAQHRGGVIVADSGVFVMGGLANALGATLVDGITRDLSEATSGDSQ